MPGWELIGDEERKLVNAVIDSKVLFAHGFDKMRQNYFVREYEQAFSDKLSTTKHHALAVSSGSAALKIALQAAEIGPGDEVITQCHTFIATVEAILEVGATPVIVDINRTLNMDTHALRAAITPKTKAVIPVHMLGECCSMAHIRLIAGNAWLIEDAAQAIGAMHAGHYAGTLGDFGCFNTDAGKTICTGEGGMILTKHAAGFKRARALHDHGHTYTKYRAEEVALCRGFNYRMTELQAAVGIAQLSKFEDILSVQKFNKKTLREKLPAWEYRFSSDSAGDAGDTLAFFFPDIPSARRYVRELNRLGLGTKNLPDALGWHFAGYWQHLGFSPEQWPRSLDILERTVAIPITLGMDVERTAALMIEAANG